MAVCLSMFRTGRGELLDGIADDVTHVSVPGCGHLVPEEQPDALADHLTAFDAGCRR